MANFYLTIGVQYSYQPHPLKIHPDGYVVVEADNELEGRRAVFELIGAQWSMLHTEEEFFSDHHLFEGKRTCDFFPAGRLGTIRGRQFYKENDHG